MARRAIATALFLALAVILPARAERDLAIKAVSLNGFTATTITVQPGATLRGSVAVQCSSKSYLKTHTAVWLPSWQKRPDAVRSFHISLGGTTDANADIDLLAPSLPGTYYLVFCFDRKKEHEMFQEIMLRTEEQAWANGRAIRIVVAANAPEPPRPMSREAAVALTVGGPEIEAVAGRGYGREFWGQVAAGDYSSDRGDAFRFRIVTVDTFVDLDLEIQDIAGRRRGFSASESGFTEQSIVRVRPNETLYARVYAFQRAEGARFRISVERVALTSAYRDPSGGRAQAVIDGYNGTARGGVTAERSSWYSVSQERPGKIEAEIRGLNPSAELDLWIYDDLGNIRAQSRMEGSAQERIGVENAEPALYYIRVGAFRSTDEKDAKIAIRLNGTPFPDAVAPAATVAAAPQPDTAGETLPVSFEVTPERDFERYIKVGTEPNFLIEVFSGWGDAGRLDTISLTAPDGSVLWATQAEGRGWEVSRITTKGPGLYRLLLQARSGGIRRGRVDVDGIVDRKLYPPARPLAGDTPARGGAGLDNVERDILKTVYESMLRKGDGISKEEAEVLRQLEDYFTKN